MSNWKTRTRIKVVVVMLGVIMLLDIYCYVAQDFIQMALNLSDAYVQAKFNAMAYLNGGGLITAAATALSIGVEKGLQKFKQGED